MCWRRPNVTLLLLAPPKFHYYSTDAFILGKLLSWGLHHSSRSVRQGLHTPEIFISESEAMTWASKHGVLENAYFTRVLDWMKTGGFLQNSYIYDDGPYDFVDFTNSAALQSAISQGPVKLGVSGDQLNSVWWEAGGSAEGGASGWFATGFLKDSDVDHRVSLCGYGTMAWLAQQLSVQTPAGVDGMQPGYAVFTWDSIGVIDVPSLLSITGEAWLRTPTTVANLGEGELLSTGTPELPAMFLIRSWSATAGGRPSVSLRRSGRVRRKPHLCGEPKRTAAGLRRRRRSG